MSNELFVPPRVLLLDEVEYVECYERMALFTKMRTSTTKDELWLLQHPPVYTQGLSCAAKPYHNDQQIPVIKSNRGGQMSYHGPGQLIIYLLLDIKRLGIGPKRLVSLIEQAIIRLLGTYEVSAKTCPGAPGVYVQEQKIAALGLRIKNGKTLHGLSLNIDMDLAPFDEIDPCGIKGLKVTQMSTLGVEASFTVIQNQLADGLIDSIYS